MTSRPRCRAGNARGSTAPERTRSHNIWAAISEYSGESNPRGTYTKLRTTPANRQPMEELRSGVVSDIPQQSFGVGDELKLATRSALVLWKRGGRGHIYRTRTSCPPSARLSRLNPGTSARKLWACSIVMHAVTHGIVRHVQHTIKSSFPAQQCLRRTVSRCID